MATYVRFYTGGIGGRYSVDSIAICKWLNECGGRPGSNINHYWRDNYTLVDFECAEDAIAFKLAFDLHWMPDREVR